jgi:hypothetical protein
VNDVDKGLEEGLDGTVSGVDSDGDGPEDASDEDTISRFREVDELVVGAEGDGVRGLAVGDGVWGEMKVEEEGSMRRRIDRTRINMRLTRKIGSRKGKTDPASPVVGRPVCWRTCIGCE